jgi:hypothetical protein
MIVGSAGFGSAIRENIFVMRSRTPYEARFRSPAAEGLKTISHHVEIDSFRTASEAMCLSEASEVEVIDFFDAM